MTLEFARKRTATFQHILTKNRDSAPSQSKMPKAIKGILDCMRRGQATRVSIVSNMAPAEKDKKDDQAPQKKKVKVYDVDDEEQEIDSQMLRAAKAQSIWEVFGISERSSAGASSSNQAPPLQLAEGEVLEALSDSDILDMEPEGLEEAEEEGEDQAEGEATDEVEKKPASAPTDGPRLLHCNPLSKMAFIQMGERHSGDPFEEEPCRSSWALHCRGGFRDFVDRGSSQAIGSSSSSKGQCDPEEACPATQDHQEEACINM